jgi:exonuclease III
MDLRPQIEPNTVIVGDLNIPLSLIDISKRKDQQRNLRATTRYTKWA